jgi:hypothetical protein
MSSSSPEIFSYGLNSHDLMSACASRFDMRPSATLDAAGRLHAKSAISYPRTDFRFIGDSDHINGIDTLKMLAASSPSLDAQIKRTNPAYKSSVWVDDTVECNASAIQPLKTADVAGFDNEEENVFSVVAERYIALFDPTRSNPRDKSVTSKNFEYRHFVAVTHRKTVDAFGTSADLVGPDFFVDGDGSISLAVSDNVTGYAWLGISLTAVSEFIVSMPFSSTEDFARRNLPLLRRFVDEANNSVLPDGGGLYVCAPNTYDVRNGVRHYKWPRS